MVNIGILSPSDIAMRRFTPALANCENAQLAGMASASPEERGTTAEEGKRSASMAKVEAFAAEHGCASYASFTELLTDENVDAVYIPLPPALHKKWATMALENGKHVLLEKPLTPCLEDTQTLVELARAKGLALAEDYAFLYHQQISTMLNLLEKGRIGDFRLLRASFGFPYRGENDFRYHASQGGGALLDCGGYPIALALLFLGSTAFVADSMLSASRGHDVDVYGSATLRNEEGRVAQVSFGMDNSYQCGMEIWGSEKTLYANRVYSPTAAMEVELTLKDSAGNVETVTVPANDQFVGSIQHFCACMTDESVRENEFERMVSQARLVDSVWSKACK